MGLLGVPDDLGVRLNGGRAGAAEGPRAFREALEKYGADFDLLRSGALDVAVFDAGDVKSEPGDDAATLAATHHRVTAAAMRLHEQGLATVGIGGGHDLTFPMARALADVLGGPAGGVNVDPHLDVRENTGSGMPFRRLIEGGFLDPARFCELGTGRFSNTRAHVEWLRERGATIIDVETALEEPEGAVRRAFAAALDGGDGPIFVSVDLDSIDGSQAPGVSAVNPMGLSAAQVVGVARMAGAEPRVRHFDIMELSPPHDEQGRTARLAALIFLSFLAGFAERGG